MFDGIKEIIRKLMTLGGVGLLLKLVILVFGITAFAAIVHFAWVFIWDMIKALLYIWTHRSTIFSTK